MLGNCGVRGYKGSGPLNPHTNSRMTTIRWSRPVIRWVKYNTDAAVSQVDYFAAIGVVLRNVDAQWRGDFSMLIGTDTVLKTEARVVYEGLILA